MMPAGAPGFDANGIDTSWPGESRCWMLIPNFAPCSAFSTNSTSVGDPTTLQDLHVDDGTQAVVLPFTFLWLGRYPVTNIRVGSNGHINIDKSNNPSTVAGFSANSIAITSTALPSGISVMHEDLNPSGGGNIRTYYSSANGSFTISYEGIPFYGSTIGTVNAQAALYPDGSVELRWGASTSDGTSSVAAGILDRSVIPPVLMPASALGFNSVGVATPATWYPGAQCQRFPPQCDRFVPISGGAPGTLTNVSTCDDCAQLLTLPFTFMWLGKYPVTRIMVDSNGNVNIDKNNTPADLASVVNGVGAFYTPTPISSTSRVPWSGISVAHEDLHPVGRGTVSAMAGSGFFIISWQGVGYSGSRDGVLSAQVVLYPDGGVELRWGSGNMPV